MIQKYRRRFKEALPSSVLEKIREPLYAAKTQQEVLKLVTD